MWELIRANRRKSMVLFMLMGICLVVLGFVIGSVFNPRAGGIIGVIAGLTIWLIMSIVSYFAGSSILLAVSHATPVTRQVHPQLYNIVEEMKIAANLPAMPKIYIIPEKAPNAFATGMTPENCAVAVTAGLLSRLNRDELQGVIAHEMSHILNRDVQFMTFAGILLGSITLLSQVFLRGLFYSSLGGSRRYSSRDSRGQGQGQLVILAIAILVAILAPIMAQILFFAISRKREYLADASAVRLTRYPEGLASALENIGGAKIPMASANKVTAPMYIAPPLQLNDEKLSALTSTHPPIAQRVKILRSLSHGVNYAEYQKAVDKLAGKSMPLIPGSGLKDTETIAVRQAGAEGKKHVSAKRAERQFGDIVRTMNKFAFLTCACGLKMKVPPEYKRSEVKCPRCGRVNKVPIAQMTAMAGAMDAAGVKI